MSASVAALWERARAEGDPNLFCEAVPYAKFLGLTASLDSSGEVETVAVSMPYIERLGGNMSVPALHGGTLGSLMETAAVLTGFWLAQGARPRIINITVDYLRPAFLEDTVATCKVLRHGRRIITVQTYARQGETLVAAAKVHLMISA